MSTYPVAKKLVIFRADFVALFRIMKKPNVVLAKMAETSDYSSRPELVHPHEED